MKLTSRELRVSCTSTTAAQRRMSQNTYSERTKLGEIQENVEIRFFFIIKFRTPILNYYRITTRIIALFLLKINQFKLYLIRTIAQTSNNTLYVYFFIYIYISTSSENSYCIITIDVIIKIIREIW